MLLSAPRLYKVAQTAQAALMAHHANAFMRKHSLMHFHADAVCPQMHKHHSKNGRSSRGAPRLLVLLTSQAVGASQAVCTALWRGQCCRHSSRISKVPCSIQHSIVSRRIWSDAQIRSSVFLQGTSRARRRSSSSSGTSEAVTRTVLGWCGALIQTNTGPAGLCAFASASASTLDLPSSIRITLSPVDGATAEQLSDCLLGFGAQSVVVEECRHSGQPEQEKFGAEAELWDSCTVMAHFPLEHDIAATIATVQDVLDLPELSYTAEQVVDEAWVEQIKASYVPVQVADQLYIIPEWSEPTDAGAINIRLSPGVAFGTGEHPTTKLCLRHLASLELSGCSVCDYGTGSGVLAIAALLMGASRAVGTDTDPLAVRAAAANAALNGVQQQLSVIKCGANLDDPDPLHQLETGLEHPQFDVVVANILRGPLLELQPRLTSYCKPGGRLALSGILTEQAPDVGAAYSAAFEHFQVISEGSWALITAVRRHS